MTEGSKPVEERLREASANPETETEVCRLRRELKQWTKWGVIEVAVRNPRVAEYCKHWEGRAEAAEAKLEKMREALTRLKCEKPGSCYGNPRVGPVCKNCELRAALSE